MVATSPGSGPHAFVFIVGCGRSGTTLLVSMLDSHPDIAIPAESGFLLDLAAPGKAVDLLPARSFVDRFVDRLREYERFHMWHLELVDLKRHLEHAGVTNPVDSLRETYRFYALVHGKPRYGDKTPDHVLVMDELADLFPEAVFLHVLRDGRDVALAMLDVDFGPRSIPEAARYWKRRVMAGRASATALGNARYAEVRYEELVLRPAAVLASVCGFVGVPFDHSMLDYGAAARRQLSMSPDPTSDKSLLRPPTIGIRDWRRDMSRVDAAVFGRVAGDLLDELGYEKAPAVRIPIARRLREGASELARLRDRRP